MFCEKGLLGKVGFKPTNLLKRYHNEIFKNNYFEEYWRRAVSIMKLSNQNLSNKCCTFSQSRLNNLYVSMY